MPTRLLRPSLEGEGEKVLNVPVICPDGETPVLPAQGFHVATDGELADAPGSH